jgi:hypothetical protein
MLKKINPMAKSAFSFKVLRYFLFFTCLFLSILTYCQKGKEFEKNEPRKSFNLKGYVAVTPYVQNVFEKSDSFLLDQKTKRLTIKPTIGLEWAKKNGFIFQINFDQISFEKFKNFSEKSFPSFGIVAPSGTETTTFLMNTSYEFGRAVYRKKDSKHSFFLCGSLKQQTAYFNLIPFSTATFPNKKLDVEATFGIIPRWQYALNNKCFLELNMPFYFTNLGFTYFNNKNPTLPTFAQRDTRFYQDWVNEAHMKVGFCVKL